MAQGTIKSYSEDKKYGFISSDAGNSFFFHRNSLKDRNAKPSIGQIVSFEEKPTPKGMAASNIVIEKSAQKIYVELDAKDLIVSKSERCGRGNEVVMIGDATYVEARNPDEAMRRLKENVSRAGFNALIHLERSSRSHSEAFDGNYQYTVHKFMATPALVMGVDYTTDKARIEDSASKVREAEQMLSEVVVKEEPYGNSSGAGILIILIVITAIIAAFFAAMHMPT